MYESIQDVVQAILPDQVSGKQHWQRLRGDVWLAHCLRVTGLSPHAFAKDHLEEDGKASKLIYKWLSGSSSPTPASAAKVDPPVPGALWLYRVLELFESKPRSTRNVEAFLKTCCRKEDASTGLPGWIWTFPGQEETTHVTCRGDSSALVERGDLWGFLGIVALVREAEARSDSEAHLARSMDMYRALPAAIRTPCVTPSAQVLKDCVDSIRVRMPFSAIMFDVDWDVVDRQSADPDYEPCRLLRRREFTPPYGFVMNDDPIVRPHRAGRQ